MDWLQHGKDKVIVTVDPKAEEHETTMSKSNRKNKGKNKRKTPEQSREGSPFLQSKRASETYINCIVAITSHFSVKTQSSMSRSFGSLDPASTSSQDDDPYNYK